MEMLFLLDTYFIDEHPWCTRLWLHSVQAKREIRQLPMSKIPGYVSCRCELAVVQGYKIVAHKLSWITGLQEKKLSAEQWVNNKLHAAMRVYRSQLYHGGPIAYAHAVIPLGDYFDPMPQVQRIACGELKIVEVSDGHLDRIGQNARLTAAALDHELLSTSQPSVTVDLRHDQKKSVNRFGRAYRTAARCH